MKNIVFVQCASGSFVQHGPVRRSEAQAVSVARQLARRLGWVAVAAESAPEAGVANDSLPSESLAGLSPVWKDADLAARWAAAARPRTVAAAPAPQDAGV